MRSFKTIGVLLLALVVGLVAGVPVRELLALVVIGAIVTGAIATTLRVPNLSATAWTTAIITGSVWAVLPAVQAQLRVALANEALVATILLALLAAGFWIPLLYLLKKQPRSRSTSRPTARSRAVVLQPVDAFPERFDYSDGGQGDDELGLLDEHR